MRRRCSPWCFRIAAFAGMMLAAPLVRKAITVGWVVACLLVVPLVAVAYQQQLHFAEWLPHTARQRIILWGYTAGEVAKSADPWHRCRVDQGPG